MTIQEIMNKKFSICLMNPPYATTGGGTIHLQFVDKLLDICDEQVVIMPFRFVTNIYNKQNNKFKPKFDKYLVSAEQQNSKELFPGVDLNDSSGVGIYHFSNHKESDKIKVKYLDKDEFEVSSLSEISNYSEYERGIVEYLDSKGSQKILGNVGQYDHKTLKGLSREELDNMIIKNSKNLKEYYKENLGYYGLVVAKANGAMKGKALTSKNGQIFNNYEDFLNMLLENKSGKGYNILMFDSKEAAENCKEALKRPLLRFTILREQFDKILLPEVYKYVPSINWESVNTDEDILIQCGCPEDKAEEYVEYCTEIIEKVDNKK